jgi:hypothetical protein
MNTLTEYQVSYLSSSGSKSKKNLITLYIYIYIYIYFLKCDCTFLNSTFPYWHIFFLIIKEENQVNLRLRLLFNKFINMNDAVFSTY